MKRRTVLATIGSAGAAITAGCLSTARPGGNPESTPTSETPSDRTPGEPNSSPSDGDPDAEPEVLSARIDTVESGCMSERGERVDVSFVESRLRIDGVAETATPCYEATIESAEVANGEATVRIGFESTAAACVECVGAIEYEAVVDTDGADGVDTVTVRHGEDGEPFTRRRAGSEGSRSSPTVTDDGTPTPPASRRGDPDLDVILVNEDDTDHEYDVIVSRESGEVVYEETTGVPGESRARIYNLEDANPDGVETFTVSATVGDQTGEITVETSACYGNALVQVDSDGELDVFYSIC